MVVWWGVGVLGWWGGGGVLEGCWRGARAGGAGGWVGDYVPLLELDSSQLHEMKQRLRLDVYVGQPGRAVVVKARGVTNGLHRHGRDSS